MPENLWQIDYQFSFIFHKEWSEAEYLARNFENAEKLFEIVLQHAKDILDKEKIYAIMIRHFITQMKSDQALEFGINTIKDLGI